MTSITFSEAALAVILGVFILTVMGGGLRKYRGYYPGNQSLTGWLKYGLSSFLVGLAFAIITMIAITPAVIWAMKYCTGYWQECFIFVYQALLLCFMIIGANNEDENGRIFVKQSLFYWFITKIVYLSEGAKLVIAWSICITALLIFAIWAAYNILDPIMVLQIGKYVFLVISVLLAILSKCGLLAKNKLLTV